MIPRADRCVLIAALAAVVGLASLRSPTPAWADKIVIQANVQAQPADNGAGGEKKIFVPEPKGAGETLDETAGQGKPGENDVVTTVRGDRIVGKVLAIEGGDKLRLASPQFEGEVVVLASAIDRLELTPTQQAKGDDEVSLSNGDRIVGEVLGITPEAVIVESEATGTLKVSRKIIKSISFSRTAVVSLESAFDQGRMEPWTALGGGWSVTDGALHCVSYGGLQCIFAKFEQKEAVTMEAKVEATANQFIDVELVLFAETKDQPYGRNSILSRFYSSHFYLMTVQNGGQNCIVNRQVGRMLTNTTLRMAYDPATSKAQVWVDTAPLGEFGVPNVSPQGKYVMFNSRHPCRVTQLRVLRGIVPPASVEKDPEVDAHVVRFANKDRVAATDMTLSDGKLTLKTAFGDIASAADKVESVAFRSNGLEEPRRAKGDVWVETTHSRLTFQFGRLTPEHLIGKSSYLGEVKVRRACLRKIQFNIYK